MNNMVMLGALGWNLEKEIGSFKFLLIYFVSGIGANLISLAMDFTLEIWQSQQVHPEQFLDCSGHFCGL